MADTPIEKGVRELPELLAIDGGGMIGGGIFSVLWIAADASGHARDRNNPVYPERPPYRFVVPNSWAETRQYPRCPSSPLGRTFSITNRIVWGPGVRWSVRSSSSGAT